MKTIVKFLIIAAVFIATAASLVQGVRVGDLEKIEGTGSVLCLSCMGIE